MTFRSAKDRGKHGATRMRRAGCYLRQLDAKSRSPKGPVLRFAVGSPKYRGRKRLIGAGSLLLAASGKRRFNDSARYGTRRNKSM
jgi:hypothetical protein